MSEWQDRGRTAKNIGLGKGSIWLFVRLEAMGKLSSIYPPRIRTGMASGVAASTALGCTSVQSAPNVRNGRRL